MLSRLPAQVVLAKTHARSRKPPRSICQNRLERGRSLYPACRGRRAAPRRRDEPHRRVARRGPARARRRRWDRGQAVRTSASRRVLADGETFDARSERPETTKFFTEWACLQLLNEIGVDAAPRFYSGDVEQGFLVMEDLGPGDRLDHALLGDDPVHARRTLVALFQTVGRMHAATIGKRGRFAEILGGLGRKMSRPDESAEAQRDAAIADTFSRLAIDPPRDRKSTRLNSSHVEISYAV